jgi:hypothetical protein
MTQIGMDIGGPDCLIGVAPVQPTEFVLFRIGQKRWRSVTTLVTNAGLLGRHADRDSRTPTATHFPGSPARA